MLSVSFQTQVAVFQNCARRFSILQTQELRLAAPQAWIEFFPDRFFSSANFTAESICHVFKVRGAYLAFGNRGFEIEYRGNRNSTPAFENP